MLICVPICVLLEHKHPGLALLLYLVSLELNWNYQAFS